MLTSTTARGFFVRQPLSFFHQFTVAVLLIGAVLLSIIKLAVGHEGGPPMLVAVSMVLVASIVVLPFSWTSVIGAIALIGYLIAFCLQPFVPYHLTLPKANFLIFVDIILLFVLFIVGSSAGFAAFIQDTFMEQQKMPNWFITILFGVVGIVLGAIGIGALS